MFKPLPAGLRPSDPVAIMATWFGSGLAAKAPGTWGSLAALPFAYAIMLAGGPLLLLAAAVVIFIVGIWAADRYAATLGASDPSEVVIDEVVAMWLTLLAAPMTPLGWFLAFVLFRLFDIAKPWPVSLADRKLKGGFGIMADDILAAFYAIIVLVLYRAS